MEIRRATGKDLLILKKKGVKSQQLVLMKRKNKISDYIMESSSQMKLKIVLQIHVMLIRI